jgi:hypothetical protein
MTHDKIDKLHTSGAQIPLDSDEIDAALAAANLDPATCTPDEAITACREFANAMQAFKQYPTRMGAPVGNSNAKKADPRLNLITARFNADDYAAIITAANQSQQSPSEWVRNAAIAAATIKNEDTK